MSQSPSSPAARQLKGLLTVRVLKCTNLHKSRMIGKMDPYVKVNVGGSEKFKSKVAENQDINPVFDQAFLFNLTGAETDLHLRVYDSAIGSDTYVGRCDQPLWNLLAAGGGPRTFDLFDPENFRKNTGSIEIAVSFNGTGGPDASAELAPIVGNFHFCHNMSGLLVHPAGTAPGSKLVLKAGGLHDSSLAFDFQGPYIRAVASSMYLTAAADAASLALQHGISDAAKWKWTGLGLQHVASGKIMHPAGDAVTPGTEMVLASGATAASGFNLVSCNGSATPSSAAAAAPPASSPITPSTPAGAPSYQPPPATNPAAAAPTWACQHCTFANAMSKTVCDMCHKSKAGAADASAALAPAASAPVVWNPHNPDTFPPCTRIVGHPHPLFKLPTIYKGIYNCDMCAQSGTGVVYHCEPCQFDVHPACAYQRKQ